MKISRIKHVIITSIIFLIVIAVIVAVYNSMLNAIKSNTEEMVFRVVATKDINPGETITTNNVEIQQVQNVVHASGMIYRLNRMDNNVESVEKFQNGIVRKEDDDLWAIGKVASEKIYKGEMLLESKIVLSEDMVGDETRLYAIPFESATTGGYNVDIGKKVDVCVLYSENEKDIVGYQNLPSNKVIDIVLAGKPIADIRDESGNSKKKNSSVVPGYVCFNLSYQEINKLEIAKRQGTLFIGSADNYYKEGTQDSTFMVDTTMPDFGTAR